MAPPVPSPRPALRRLVARAGRRLVAIALPALLAACAAAPPPPPPCPAEPTTAAIAAGDLMGLPAAATSDAIPVGADDPQRGRADALVTIVAFGDFQCPFCARANPTLDRLAEAYGPEQVRIVWKHLPLPFHEHARPIAEMSAAVMKLGGSDAFWRFHRRAFEDGGRQDARSVGALAQASGYDAPTLGRAIAEHGSAKVDADQELAARLGVRGTPGFLINGAFLSGAQPYEAFAEIVDAEIVAAKRALADGTPRGRLYAARVAENLAASPREPVGAPPAPPPEDRAVWAVPIDGSPVLGRADAPVTIVALTDYQCPFCARANATIAELRKKYGDQIRIVHKHRPLPFHKQARPASELALEILARKGNAAFWKANDLLFAMQDRMRSPDGSGDPLHADAVAAFGDVAEQLGVPRAQALAAVRAKKHDARIARDELLAEDLDASGTPTFFVNGRRLTGAQPQASFEELIDAELAKARTLIAGGTPAAKLYDEIVAMGKKAAALELPTADLPAPTAKNPSRGPAGAPVVVQVFSDFECPFCQRFAATLDELGKAYPSQVRIVFRHLPLPMHPNAGSAAEASMEAFAQGGSQAFWRMHDALFEAGGRGGSLDRQALEAAGKEARIDVARLGAALDDGRHRAHVDADARLAATHDINGTPTIVIGRYVVSGAQPLAQFRRVVDRVLADQKAPKAAVAR